MTVYLDKADILRYNGNEKVRCDITEEVCYGYDTKTW